MIRRSTPGQSACGKRAHPNRCRRCDGRAQRAVETPLRAELPAPGFDEPLMDAVPATGQRVKRGGGGQHAAADGEPQAIPCHRVDESRGIARQHQTGDGVLGHIDGQRPEDDRRLHQTSTREPVAQPRIPLELCRQEKRGRAQHLIGRLRGPHEADVRKPSRHRRDAEITPASNVHFAQ